VVLGYPSAVRLSATLQHLNQDPDAPQVSALFYLSTVVQSYTFTCLVDCGSAINIVHPSIPAKLGIEVKPCVGPRATLADGETVLECNSHCSIPHIISGRSMTDTFFIASIGVQAFLLGMPFLETHNPVMDWSNRTLSWRTTTFPGQSASAHDSFQVPGNCGTVMTNPTEASLTSATRTPQSRKRPLESGDGLANPPYGTRQHMPKLATPPSIIPSSYSRQSATILPTRHIDPKHDQLLLFNVLDVTGSTLASTMASEADSNVAPIYAILTIRPLSGVPEEYSLYANVFEKRNAEKLPPHRPNVDHEIPLIEGAKPTYGPIYNLSELELKTLKEYIDRMLAKGFIRPSKSPFGSPVLFVKKADGSLRLCVDYRKLNDITIKNRYPLPLISELFDRLKHARIYTRLDLQDAYNQLRIARGDEWKTAFRTRYGHFEYLVMPFGLTNAPASFQAYANDCLREYLDDFCVVFMDDVLIYSNSMEEHIGHVRKVLSKLRDYDLTCKLSKCEFHSTSISFLGFIISPNGIAMEPDRVTAIREWPAPSNVHDIQVFLGFANFYRRFIQGFSRVVAPITSLLQKGQRFDWSNICQKALDELKSRFTSAPILKHFDPDLPIRIHTDASGFAVSGIISQLHNPLWHPVAFYSRKLSPAECNYDVPDREMLAIVESMRHWRHYLEGA